MDATTVRAIVGARVSTFVEGKESQVTQRTKGTAYAAAMGWPVVGTFQDIDVSAIKRSPWDRPDLRVWLTDRADDWEALIFAKTDRVFRSASDCVKLAEWCKQRSKILVLVDDGIKLDYFHPDTEQDAFAGAMSRVFLILASVFAEIEGQRFVQRAHDRVTQYRHQPRWAYGLPPFGFTVVDRPEGGKALGHDSEAQQVLHDIADSLIGGDSLTNIASRLNANGVLSPADSRRHAAGKPTTGCRWSVNRVRTVLTNPATQGVKTAAGKPVLDADGNPVLVGPPSFDPETWHRIQDAIQQRSMSGRSRTHSVNPLLGVAKCGECGRNMRYCRSTTRAGKTHKYYICGATPRACTRVLVKADEAERAVTSVFLFVHRHRWVKTRIWQSGSDHSIELEQTTRTIEALRSDRALGLFPTDADQEIFRTQIGALIAKRDALASQPTVKAGWVEVDTEDTYGDVWPDATVEDRRKLLTDAGVTLTVYRGGRCALDMDTSKAIGGATEPGWLKQLFAVMPAARIAGVEINPDGSIEFHPVSD